MPRNRINSNGVPRGRSQREVLRDVLLGAAECGTWLTLHDLSHLTHYPEASISAQIRHLRKPKYGAFKIAKQFRGRSDEGGGVFEYRLEKA
jgi:hypothetical protein